MRSTKHRFPGSRGAQLTALLDLPDRAEPKAYALFAHCFTCTKDYKSIFNINRTLTARGWGVLRFDFTGLGESGGDFADTNFSSNVEDLLLAASFVGENYGPPRMLLGHSLGGAAAIQAAHRLPSVRGVVTVAAPAEPRSLRRHFEDRISEIDRVGEAPVTISGRTFVLRRQFFQDLDRSPMAESIRTLQAALLVLHAPGDDTVPIANGERIFALASQPKAFVALQGADHLLLREKDSRHAGEVIAAWAEPFMDEEKPGE